MKQSKKYRLKNKKNKGQAMVEFIAVLALYYFLIGFMITGFQIMHNKMVFNMAAYEGVRSSIVYNGGKYQTALGLSRAESMLQHVVGADPKNITVDIKNGGDTSTCRVSGKINYLFPLIDPSSGQLFKNDITLHTEFSMRNERQ